MDGVIYHGKKLLPGVPEFIKWLNDEKKTSCFSLTTAGILQKNYSKDYFG